MMKKSMKRSFSAGTSFYHLRVILASFLLILIGLIPIAATGKSKGPRAAPVKVEKIIQRTVRPYITLIGTAEPFRKSTVASAIDGLVIGFSVRLGQRIKKGEVLARTERTVLSLDLKRAKASLAEANENYKNASSDLRRIEELFKKKTVSTSRYDVARYKVNALKQKILALQAEIEAIKHDISRCSIKAPFSGFVVDEHTEVGQWLKRGGSVVTIVDMDPIIVTVPVPDRYIRFVKPGQTIDLEFGFLPGHKEKKRSCERHHPGRE